MKYPCGREGFFFPFLRRERGKVSEKKKLRKRILREVRGCEDGEVSR